MIADEVPATAQTMPPATNITGTPSRGVKPADHQKPDGLGHDGGEGGESDHARQRLVGADCLRPLRSPARLRTQPPRPSSERADERREPRPRARAGRHPAAGAPDPRQLLPAARCETGRLRRRRRRTAIVRRAVAARRRRPAAPCPSSSRASCTTPTDQRHRRSGGAEGEHRDRGCRAGRGARASRAVPDGGRAAALGLQVFRAAGRGGRMTARRRASESVDAEERANQSNEQAGRRPRSPGQQP